MTGSASVVVLVSMVAAVVLVWCFHLWCWWNWWWCSNVMAEVMVAVAK